MKTVKEIKNDFCKFYFLNTDISFTISSQLMKLEEYLNNVLLVGSMPHFLYSVIVKKKLVWRK